MSRFPFHAPPRVHARVVSRQLRAQGFERAEGIRAHRCAWRVPDGASGFHCWLGTQPELDWDDPNYFGVVVDWYGSTPPPLDEMKHALEQAGYTVALTTGNVREVCQQKPDGTWDIQYRLALSVRARAAD